MKSQKVDDDWEKKEICDVVHWIRQFFGLLCGIIWGIIPLYGLIGNVSFLIINVLVLFLYYSKYLNVDDEKLFGGHWDLIQEGFFSSYAIFLVFWILTYNALWVG